MEKKELKFDGMQIAKCTVVMDVCLIQSFSVFEIVLYYSACVWYFKYQDFSVTL